MTVALDDELVILYENNYAVMSMNRKVFAELFGPLLNPFGDGKLSVDQDAILDEVSANVERIGMSMKPFISDKTFNPDEWQVWDRAIVRTTIIQAIDRVLKADD